MGRIIVVLLAATMLSGCIVWSTVSGVAGAAVDGVFYMFRGSEQSLSLSMRSTLVAVQRGLEKSGLHVNVLEPVEEGYLIALGNDNLDGQISLEKQTESLTTVKVKVKGGSMSMRQDSIELALIDSIQEQGKKVGSDDRFDFTHYQTIHEKSDEDSKVIGWFLPGTLLEVKELHQSEWLLIDMPSGANGYLKGSLAAAAGK